ncbi:hypothetical protein B0J12DRAFT_283320 [Macrophomina phaseolina]|uniref:Uncharacterized protein n=1 Tax=Macrophomina phaseolina TaxID=35725 RepID=A0ABQ8GN06_9PEZI|nr:hypothetical protein B0J12DRAFT_283320 [Macrophomina phaseolina]
MGLIIQDYNLQEYMSMVFYCIVGSGVIFHWIHVWMGKPDSRIKALESRMRRLEEGIDSREVKHLRQLYNAVRCALMQYGFAHSAPQQKALAGTAYPAMEPSGRRDSGCYASSQMPPHFSNAGSLFTNINDGPNSLFHAPPPSQRQRVDSYFNAPCYNDSVAPHEITVPPSCCRSPGTSELGCPEKGHSNPCVHT